MVITNAEQISSKNRCANHRLRLLEISQRVSALHLAGAFSCIEIIDTIYYHCMDESDVFILSKGHAGIAQYVILESLGLLEKSQLDNYSQLGSSLGVHPTKDIPGIYFGTGSLGHGLNIAIGSALIKKRKQSNKITRKSLTIEL